MNAEIICVGTELLLGNILNTNAVYLAQELAILGLNVFHQTTVGDNPARLKDALETALTRSSLVVLTGGLGPTEDDLTKETVAELLHLPLEEDTQSLARMTQYFQELGRPMPLSNRKQALRPSGATVFVNDEGTAPGFAIPAPADRLIILLPGPPKELKAMCERYVFPFIKTRFGGSGTIRSHNVHIVGLGESQVAERAGSLLNGANPTVAPYAKEGEVLLRVTARADSPAQADAMCEPVLVQLKSLFGEAIYGIDCENLQQVVVTLLRKHGLKLATAESCTAGLLSARLTDVPGSSDVFDMGITAYANDVKINALGVNPKTLAVHGAVSEQTAVEMADGIRAISSCDLGLSITGVAGPESSENKPVGLVYLALSDGAHHWVHRLRAGNGREHVRSLSVLCALNLVRQYLLALPSRLSNGTPIGAPAEIIEGFYPTAGCAQQDQPAAQELPAQPAVDEAADTLPDAKETASPLQTSLYLNEEDGDSDITDSPFVENSGYILPDEDEDMLNYAESAQDAGLLPDQTQKEKCGRFKRFWKSVLPWKGDRPGEIVRKILFLVFFATLVISASMLIAYFAESRVENNRLDDARTSFYNVDPSQTNDEGRLIRFDELYARNTDIKGWLTIPGTKTDNPVYQTDNNDFYVTHNMDKAYSAHGALFIDFNGVLTADEQSQNLVIYGHNMKDGSMFGELSRFKDINFYKENPALTFTTLYGEASYKIFAIMITNTKASDDNGAIFNYRPSRFASQSAFLTWIAMVQQRSVLQTAVDIKPDDRILTLSTCAYDFDDARLVVFARKVREGESTSVNVNEAKYNPNPRYPAAYYTSRGLSVPTFPAVETVTMPESDFMTPSVVSQSSSTSEATSSTASAATSSRTQSAVTSLPAVSSTPAQPASSAPFNTSDASQTSSLPPETTSSASQTENSSEENIP